MNLVPSAWGKKYNRKLDSSRSLPLEFGHRRAQNDKKMNNRYTYGSI
jgi:hypothetical protein